MMNVMKTGLGRTLLAATAVAGVMALAAPQAHATFLIQTSADGSSWNNYYSNATDGTTYLSPGGLTVNGLSITQVNVTSNSPGSVTASYEDSSAFSVKNTTSAAITAYLLVTSQNFTTPSGIGPFELDNSIAGTITNAGIGSSVQDRSAVSQLNLSGAPILGSSNITSWAVAPLSGHAPYLADTNIVFSPLASPYSMAQEIEITLGAGAQIAITADSQLYAVPEPATYATFAVGLLALAGMGFTAARRRG